MQEHLQFIEQFANTISNTFRQFAGLCRTELAKTKENKPDYADLVQQLIKERKLRMELEDKIKQRISGLGSEQPPSLPNSDQKRPQNAFALFLADQRVKINKEHPSIDFYKISTIAAIKWKKLTEEQQQIYERKFEQISKLYDEQEQLIKQGKLPQTVNDASLVKKEFAQEQQQIGKDGDMQKRAQQDIQQKENEENKDFNQIFRNSSNQDAGLLQHQPEIMPTMPMDSHQENQPTLPMEEPKSPLKTDTIEKILGLFHTPASQNADPQINEPVGQFSYMHAQQSIEPLAQNTKLAEAVELKEGEEQMEVNEPSLMIVEPPKPIVIDPTIQQQQE